MTTVIACIDGSPSSAAVCDYSAWASVRLASPLTLVHILEDVVQAPTDLSGSIGLGSREHLLQVWVRRGDLDKTEHAMNSLIHSVLWDEARFGLPLDLERFMVLAKSALGESEDGELRLLAAQGDWAGILGTASTALRSRLTPEA